MCSVCGCSAPAADRKDAAPGGSRHHDQHGHDHGHRHDHVAPDHGHSHPHHGDHAHASPGVIDFGAGSAGLAAPGLTQERILRIEQDVFAANDAFARANRARLRQAGVFALNLISSPGSGKTTLLVTLIEALAGRRPVAVIEGDQQTDNDAARIRATGAPALQINTGKGCHLDAHMVAHALDQLELASRGLLFIENVGNLVCPAGFDLGETHKVVVVSVTEGEDKPLKYPGIFTAADLMVLTKADLLPYLDADQDAYIANALRINPRIQTLCVSAKTGQGLPALLAWIEARADAAGRAAAAE